MMVQIRCCLLNGEGALLSTLTSKKVEKPESIECLFPEGGWISKCGAKNEDKLSHFALGEIKADVFGTERSAVRTIRVELTNFGSQRKTWEIRLRRHRLIGGIICVKFEDAEKFEPIIHFRRQKGTILNSGLDVSDDRFPFLLLFREFPQFFGEQTRDSNREHGDERVRNVSNSIKRAPGTILRKSVLEASNLTIAVPE